MTGLQRLRSLGIAGAVTLALVAGALALWVGVLPQREAAVQAAADSAREERLAALRAARTPSPAAPAEAADRTFVAGFPPAAGTPARITALWRLAAPAGLVLRRADVRSQAEAGAVLVAEHLTLPLRGSYEALRQYVERALAQDGALVLDRVRLQRAQPGSAELQAELQFTLLARPAGAGR